MGVKKKHRKLEALRRLGAAPPEPDPNFRCQHHRWTHYGECQKPPVRLRECWWDGIKRWFCLDHDPVRLDHEAKNKKKRDELKRERWKRMEHERKGNA